MLGFLLFIGLKKRKRKTNELFKAVETACLKGDMEKASQALLAWASERFSDRSFFNLADLRKMYEGRSDNFVFQLREVERYLYGTGRFARHLPKTGKKLGREVFAAFAEASRLKHKKKKEKKKNLPSLYP